VVQLIAKLDVMTSILAVCQDELVSSKCGETQAWESYLKVVDMGSDFRS
jgi:hypothetical protein